MKKNVLIGIFAISILSILLTIGVFQEKKARHNFNEFNSAVIDSQIKSIRIAYKGTGMRLMDGREFVFYPLTDKGLNEGKKFSYTAEEGDHVFKAAFSDTLFLIHGDKKLAYTFKRMTD
ncbi:hypothetical protein [Algoriphagus formosus]|uniref:hypothetical protein n=1 Tax=Algoriphagus formosus TaxID=2007308 RepID=UPI000C292F7E|nr:hypothetical protein [Algoriphagus formosus]